MVLHSGNYERIAFRHRETQTLFVSKAFEVKGNSSYSRIHLALYVAILRDAVARLPRIAEQAISSEAAASTPAKRDKRPREEDTEGPRKRTKPDPSPPVRDSEILSTPFR